MNDKSNAVERVIGFDAHPDSFTAAALRGSTPATAVVEKTFNKVPMAQLQNWARKHTAEPDLFVLEASGNSFQVVRPLTAIGRKAKVLESCHLGKLKEAHANNDKISAVRIGKAYLAGTAKEVWVPDAQTQERRDWFYAYTKATKSTTQMQARLRSYLSDNGVRLNPGTRLTKLGPVEQQIRHARSWSSRQWQVIEILLAELRHADQQRRHWRSLIAQEVLADPSCYPSCDCAGCAKWSRSPWARSWVTFSALPPPSNSSSMPGLILPSTTAGSRSGAAVSGAMAISSCAAS
jgi:transposase